MTLKDFTNITLKVIAEDGIADYSPTLALPEARHIQAIEGIPEDIPHTEAIQKVIARSGLEKKEFFFGVRSGKGLITTGHYRPGKPTTFMLIRETPDGYSFEKLKTCSWWTVGFQQDAPPNAGPVRPSRISKSPARGRR